jgi:hypothetical protein
MKARLFKLLGVVFLTGIAACSATLPLDEVLGPGQARAGKVSRDSELIGGPVAYARAGEVYKLYNARVRFLIQDSGTSVGLDLYGGNIIDADLVRPDDDGKNGNDLFRETFPIVGLRVPNPTSVEVIADGNKGGAAHLRVHAVDASSGILPQLDAIAIDLHGEITTDYILSPDVPYLQIVTTFKAPPDVGFTGLVMGDFLSFGASLTVISPENGFTGASTSVSFLGTVGARTSYGYVYPEGELQIPLVDASGTVTLLKNPAVPPGGEVQMTRYLVVGDGDAASVMGPMYTLRHLATGQVSGVVRDEGKTRLGGQRVTLFRAPYEPTKNAVNQATTREDGSFAFELPEGEYDVIVSGVGQLRSRPVRFAVPWDGQVWLDLWAGEAGRASIDIGEIVEGKRRTVPAKVSFLGIGVEPPDPRFGPDPTEHERHGLHAVVMTASGQGELKVKPGTYDVLVSHGPEYDLLRRNGVIVPAGGHATIRGDLLRSVDTAGWVSGDYHQHTQGSIDSPVPLRSRVIENLVEGVELPAPTDHDNITDYRPHIAALSAGALVNAVLGDEISINTVGHFNAYPLTVDPADPYRKLGAKLWANLSVTEMVKRVRGMEPGDIIVHVSHPRGKSLGGYFTSIHFDPISGESDEGPDALAGFDAIEVNGDLGTPEDFLATSDAEMKQRVASGNGIPTLRDFFALLNQGRPVCALGNSDTHERNGGTGYPRNYLFVGKDAPAEVSQRELVAAISGQRVTVCNGPFVTAAVNGVQAFGKAQPVKLAAPGPAMLDIRVQAPDWINVRTIEVYENGRPLSLLRKGAGALEAVPEGTMGATLAAPLLPLDRSGAVRFAGGVAISPLRDAWYVVLVRGDGGLSPIGDGSPYAYTNPIYVDVSGDGWTPVGL